MAYLFLGTATNTAGARTSALTQFFRTLYLNGLQSPEFFLMDKDWALHDKLGPQQKFSCVIGIYEEL